MKCERLSVCLLLLFFFLFAAGMFPRGSAAGAAAEVETSRAAGLAAEAPMTPEDLLRLIREWMDDPYMDGYTFIERLSGVEREKWKEFPKSWSAGGKNYSYDPFDYFDKTGNENPVSFDVLGVQITSSNHLWDIIIPFPDKSFCVSAEMVREILGEPGKIKGRLPNKSFEFGPPQAILEYYYKTEKYEIEINFPLKKGRFKDRSCYSRKKRKELKSLIENLSFHRGICAGGIRFGTYEGRGEK